MLGRLAALAALAALMGCAGMEPAGRNASRAPQPSPQPVVSAPAPQIAPPYTPPPSVTAAPLPAATPAPAPAAVAAPAPRAAAPAVVATPAPSRATAPVVIAQPAPAAAEAEETTEAVSTQSRRGDIVVPAERERQVPVPNGDPRSSAERMQDVRAWDRCVTNVQSAFESDPMRPQLESPEEYCSQSLGMANRNSIPLSRQERRR